MSNGTLTPPVGPEDHVQGSEHAPVTLVEYGDFECPHCGRAHPVVQQLQRELGDTLRFVFRHFPLREAHPHAEHAAEAAESAAARGGEEAFWEMHDLMFENQEALNDESLLAYAEAAGVARTAVAADLAAGATAAVCIGISAAAYAAASMAPRRSSSTAGATTATGSTPKSFAADLQALARTPASR